MEDSAYCHKINEHFLNRCFAIDNSSFVRGIVEQVFYYFSPKIIMGCIVILQLVIPHIFSKATKSHHDKALRLYNIISFSLMSLFHRITYTFTLVPWVRYFINQPGPCSSAFLRVPSYNFPYSYSVSSVIFGMAILDFSSFKPSFLVPLSLLLIFVPSTAYVLVGWVSIGQVVSSSMLAVFLHYFTILTNNMVTIIEILVLLVANIATLFISIPQDMNTERNSSYHMIHGLGALFYDLYLIIQFLSNNEWTFIDVSRDSVKISMNNENVKHGSLRQTLVEMEESASFDERMASDKKHGFIAFMILLLIDGLNYMSRGL